MFKQGTEQIIVFESGGAAFGLELDRVEGIIEKNTVTRVPNAPSVAEGIVYHRDNVLPVLNLSRLLNVENGTVGGLLVVVRGVSEDFGLSSDRIYCITPADMLKLRHIPLEERKNPYIQGAGEINGVEFSLLDFRDIGT